MRTYVCVQSVVPFVLYFFCYAIAHKFSHSVQHLVVVSLDHIIFHISLGSLFITSRSFKSEYSFAFQLLATHHHILCFDHSLVSWFCVLCTYVDTGIAQNISSTIV